MTEDQVEALKHRALQARLKAYAPYSNFWVGAAILLPDGNIVEGCNVENASYGLSICAERNAATTMVSMGSKHIAAVAVATRGAVTPCGACRQFLAEFGRDFPIFLIETETESIETHYRMDELLPYAFDSSRL